MSTAAAGAGTDNAIALAKIMVIDDSQTIRKTAETLLVKEGYAVITAADGFEALAKVADHEPDLIFIDIMMPRLDGYQACALIKNNARYARTRVVLDQGAGLVPVQARHHDFGQSDGVIGSCTGCC